MIYTFDTILLSANKLGFPNRISSDTSLSARGVNVMTLSTNDVGIAFNAISTTSGVLIDCTVQGSTFKIDRSYHQSQMALVKGVQLSAAGLGTIFQFVSTGTVGVGLSTNYRDFTTPETRRKWVLGYR
jgi:hypothetical protein